MSELGLWLDEQRAGLASRDCGQSEDATETLLKKLDRVVMELEQQRKTVERLQESGASLQHLGHPERSVEPQPAYWGPHQPGAGIGFESGGVAVECRESDRGAAAAAAAK